MIPNMALILLLASVGVLRLNNILDLPKFTICPEALAYSVRVTLIIITFFSVAVLYNIMSSVNIVCVNTGQSLVIFKPCISFFSCT